MATNRKVLRAAMEWARYDGGRLRDYRGWTLRHVFQDATRVPQARVYWGLWTDAELDTPIASASMGCPVPVRRAQ